MVSTVVIGAINWDINLFIKSFPRKGEEVIVTNIARVPGGKAGNVAVAAARLLGPDQAAILGALGNDSIATEQVKAFQKEGVGVSGLKFSSNIESGQAYIVIDEEGGNIIHTFFGANNEVMPRDLDDPKCRALIHEARIITIMDPPFETAIKLAQDAKQQGKTVVWDPGVRASLGLQNVKPLLKNTDYAVANEVEVENLTSLSNPEEAARRIMTVNPKLKVVVKLGAKGCLMLHEGESAYSPPLDLAPLGMKVVNTVACGDAFLGALVAALSEGRSDTEALKWGNCAGGLKATRVETRGSPDRDTFFRYLQ